MKTTRPKTAILPDSLIDAIAEASHYGLSEASRAALAALEEYDTIPDLTDGEGDEVNLWEVFEAVSTESVDDECGEHVYFLAGGLAAHLGIYEQIVYRADSLVDALSGWDSDNYGGPEQLLVAFGLDPEIEEAEEGHEGPVRIWCSPHYYSGHRNAPSAHWVTDHDATTGSVDLGGGPMVFDSYAEAKQWIEETEDAARGYKSETDPRGCYLLSHCEYAAPDYTISPA